MESPEVIICHTFLGDTNPFKGLAQDYLLTAEKTKYYTIELKLDGEHEINEFKDVNSTLESSKAKTALYRFIEYTDIDKNTMILVLHNILYSNKFVAYQNYYGIGEIWKLYVNSKDDIVVQHVDFPKVDVTIRFRDFDIGSNFYLCLSCLIYVLTNYTLKTPRRRKKHITKSEREIFKMKSMTEITLGTSHKRNQTLKTILNQKSKGQPATKKTITQQHLGEALARKSRRRHGVFLEFSLFLSLFQDKERKSNTSVKLKAVTHHNAHKCKA